MATDLERLVVQLSADVRGFQNEMLKANGIANKQARAIENRFKSMNRNLDGIGKGMARSLIAPLTGIAAAISVREVLQYADAWTKAKNSLAVAGVTGRQQKVVLDQLFAAAQRNATPLATLTDLYGRAAVSAKGLGASQKDLIQFVDGIAVALKASGTSAEAASGALTQLGQALGAGTVRAEEFNSILEGAPGIARAVANGLAGVNGDIGKLRKIMLDGGLASKDFFNAFLRGLPSIKTLAANATDTIEGGVTRVTNAFTKYIGETDSSLGASQRLVGALNALADNFDETADLALNLATVIAAALVGRSIAGMITSLGLGTAALIRFGKAMKSVTSTGSLVTAFSGLGRAAGPIGLVIGTAVAGAFEIYSARAEAAAERSDYVTKRLEEMGITAEDTAGQVNAVADAQDRLSADGIAKQQAKTADALAEQAAAAEKAKKEIAAFNEEANATMQDIRGIMEQFFAASFDEGDWGNAAKRVIELQTAFIEAKLDINEVKKALDEVAVSQPNMATLISALLRLNQRLNDTYVAIKKIQGAAGSAAAAIDDGPKPNRRAGIAADRARLNEKIDAGRQGLKEASKSAGISEGEKRLTDEMERLRKEIAEATKETGIPGIVTEAQLRQQAQKNLAAGDLTKSVQEYVDQVITAESSGNRFAKNDNSTATGLGQFIESTWIRLFKANFPDRAKNMSNAAILALRTDAEISKRLIEAYAKHNAEVLQRAGISVDKAALHLAHFLGEGDAVKVLKAAPGTPLKGLISPDSIAANPKQLGGGRTVDDAIAYAQRRAGISTAGVQRLEANQSAEINLADQQLSLDLLKQEVEFRKQLGPITDQNRAALIAFQQAALLLNQAQQEGAAVGLELHDVNQLLHGDLSGLSPAAREQAMAMRELATQYGATQAAAENLDTTQSSLQGKIDAISDIGRDALGGLISDLRASKDAAEILGNALDRIADRLINMGLDALFSTAGAGGGLGGIIAALFKKDGGIVHAAGGGRVSGRGSSRSDSIPAMLSNGEYVVNAASTKRYRALLEQINSGGGIRMAAGGFVGTPGIPMQAGARQVNMNLTIDLTGANGNDTIARIAKQAAAEGAQQAYKAATTTARKSVSSWVMQDRLNGGGDYRT